MEYGKWEVIKSLGEGGQGRVYLVKDTEKTGRTSQKLSEIEQSIRQIPGLSYPEDREKSAEALVAAIKSLSETNDPKSLGALKVLHKPKEDSGFEKALGRMKREVDALQKLNHPNILRILDHNMEEAWFVGEYHPGQTLWEHKEIFKGDIVRALPAFRPLVEAVAHLHKAGLVHRDIKPHNVFIACDGRLVLGDFGIVFFDDPNRTRVTDRYENVGSRDWMPGWAQGRRIEDTTSAFDVFGLGKLLWAMLSGASLLPLWYHHERAYELEEMFEKDDAIKWARIILDKCIVEKELQCLRSGSDLLLEVDTILLALNRHGQVVADGVVRNCTVCGLGRYESIANEDITSIHNFGLDPHGNSSFKIFTCSYCGHVELFHIGNPNSKPFAWKPGFKV
jgi:serine/threonine protein kinase